MKQGSNASNSISGDSHPSRLAIVRSALKLFQSGGYAATGVATILADVGLPKGSFYHHFPGGKEEIALAALDWLRSEILSWMDAAIRNGTGFDELVLGLADYAAKGLANAEHMRGSLITVLASEAVPSSAAITAAVNELLDEMTRRLAATLPEGQSQAEVTHGYAALAFVEGATTIARICNDPDRVRALTKVYLSRR